MILIYIVLLVIIGLLMYYFVVGPDLDRYRTAKSDYHSQQQREMRLIAQRDALVREYLALREEADQVQKLIFTKREAEDFMEMLPKLSKKTKNALASIAPRGSAPLVPKSKDPKVEPTPLDEISQIPIQTNITGGYGDIISLFKILEGYEQLMAISDINMNSDYDNPGTVSSSFSLNLIHLRSAIKHPSYDMLARILTGKQLVVASEEETNAEQAASSQSKATEKEQQLAARKMGEEDVTVSPPDVRTGKRTPGKRQTPLKQKPGENIRTVRYSIKIVLPDPERNMKEISGLLLSRKHDSWMLPYPAISSNKQYLLAGKFKSIKEADKFSRLMQNQLPWVDECEIIEGTFDYNVILKKHRILKRISHDANTPVIEDKKADQDKKAKANIQKASQEINPENINAKYTILAGTFSLQKNAEKLVDLLKSYEYPAWLRSEQGSEKTLYAVFVGRFISQNEAHQFGQSLQKKLSDIKEYRVKKLRKQ